MKKLFLFFLSTLLINHVFAQPANDNSCGAVAIPVENLGCEPTVIYNYTGATWSSGSGNTWCENNQNLDVWYSFVVPANGQAIVSLATVNLSEFYTAEMYNGSSCSSLTIFSNSTHGFYCLYSGESRTFTNLTPGNTVYMRIYRRFNITPPYANGSFKICVSNNYTLTDEPCNAGFFPVASADPLGQDCVPVTTYSWTGATLTPAIPNPSCIAPMPGANVRDVWFKLRVPASGKLRINHTYNGTCLVAYTATACNGTFTELGCTFSGLNWTNLTPNSIIYIRMMKYTGTGPATADGSAKICAAESNQVPTADNGTKVGIGIDTPFAKLDVVGTGIFRDKLTALGDIETRGNLIVQGNIISKYGNTSLPNNISVGGQLSLDSMAFTNRLGNRLSLYGGLGNTPHYGFGIQSGLLQIHSDASNTGIAFGYGSSNIFYERARVINSGEYGFNITGRLGLRTGTQSAGLWLNNSANTGQVGFMGVLNDNHFGLYAGTPGWGLVMNNSNGNIGIGNTNPLAPLSFNNPFGKIAISLFRGSLGDVGMGVWANELRLQCDNPFGKVSLGTLDGSSNYMELAKAEKNGAYAFSIFGSLWVNGTTYASDERFKQNISAIQSPLKKLMRLKGVEYEMKTDKFSKNRFQPGKQIGLLAQNVEQVVPEAVSEMDGYKGVDYAKLVPLLIESIKEQQKQIEELKHKINLLQNK
jgi:hypothetical protein